MTKVIEKRASTLRSTVFQVLSMLKVEIKKGTELDNENCFSREGADEKFE